MFNEVLHFWFNEIEKKQWFTVDTDFDALIKNRFEKTLLQAVQGELFSWRDDPKGRLAEIILLDQFSRNIYRGDARAFAQDSLALVLAQEAVRAGALEALDATERPFLLMPYMHSESKTIHEQAEALFKTWASAETYDFELRHKAIVDRFGRYPHRNAILNRTSSAEELEFLQQPNSSF